MNRFSTLMAVLTGVALILGSPAESHAAKKKKPTADSSDDDASTPAPKQTPALNLPLPSRDDEIAVLRILRPQHWPDGQPEIRGHAMASPDDQLIQIPTPRKV